MEATWSGFLKQLAVVGLDTCVHWQCLRDLSLTFIQPDLCLNMNFCDHPQSLLRSQFYIYLCDVGALEDEKQIMKRQAI